MHRAYEFGDYLVGVRTNSEAVGDWLDRHLGQARSSEEAEPYYSIMVAEDDGRPGKRFHILYRETTAVARAFDLAGIGRTLLSELEGFLARGRDDAIYTDLAPVTSNGTVGLVPSMTVAFIDTLGGRVRRAGLALPVATRTAIDLETGQLRPIEPLLGIADEAFDELGALGHGGADGRVLLTEPSRVDVVCAVGTATEALTPVSPAQAAHRLAAHVLNLEQLGGAALEGLTRVTTEARCFEVKSDRASNMLDAIQTAIRPE